MNDNPVSTSSTSVASAGRDVCEFSPSTPTRTQKTIPSQTVSCDCCFVFRVNLNRSCLMASASLHNDDANIPNVKQFAISQIPFPCKSTAKSAIPTNLLMRVEREHKMTATLLIENMGRGRKMAIPESRLQDAQNKKEKQTRNPL